MKRVSDDYNVFDIIVINSLVNAAMDGKELGLS